MLGFFKRHSADSAALAAEAEARRASAEADLLRARMEYDAVSQESERRRRAPKIEYLTEEEMLKPHSRAQAIGRCRDLRRNFGGEKALEWSLSMGTIGSGQKAMPHTGDTEWDAAARAWFNKTWARQPMARNRLHLSDVNRIVVGTIRREGDLLLFFDHAGIVREGKLVAWEGDQIIKIDDGDFRKRQEAIAAMLAAQAPLSQVDGVILDATGAPVGYSVTGKHGLTAGGRYLPGSEKNQITIVSAHHATLLMSPWRINQLRGISDAITTANEQIDDHEIAQAVKGRFKMQAFLGLIVKKRDPVRSAISRSSTTDKPTLTDAESTYKNYENFETWTQNRIEYLARDDEMEAFQMSGDYPDAVEYLHQSQRRQGFAGGLTGMYSTGKADASYSAAMAEANLSDWTFQYWRKWAERYLLDWEFEQAVEWAMRTGAVPNKPMLDIIGNVGWAGWPERGAINPSQEANAKKVRLSIGDLTYEDMIGPDAYDKLAAQGDLLKRLRDAGFFPEQHTFNSASGGGNGQ